MAEWSDTDFGSTFGEGYEGQGAYSPSEDTYNDISDTISSENMGEALGYDTERLGDLGGYLSPDTSGFDVSSLFGRPTLENLESYYSAPTQIGYSGPLSSLAGTVGYSPGTQQQVSPELAEVKAMLASPSTTGMSWDQAQQARAQMQNLSPVGSWNPEQVQAGLKYAYESNPLTRLASYGTTAGTIGALVNPLAGLLGPVSSAIDYGLRSYYGQPRSATGIGGTIGGALGGLAGPAGSVLGKSIGESAVAGLEGQPAGETFGRSFGTGVAGTLGSLFGGTVAGPIGAKIGSIGLQDLAKMAMSAQAMKAQREGEKGMQNLLSERAGYASQLANLPQTFQSSPIFQAQQRQALQAGLRGLSAAGKLGSGARAYAMGNVASDIANQYYGQEANRLAQLAGTPAQNLALQRAANQARGARTDLRSSILADLLQRFS